MWKLAIVSTLWVGGVSQALQICSGDVSARKLNAELRFPLASICLHEEGERLEVLVGIKDPKGEIIKKLVPGRTEKRVLPNRKVLFTNEPPVAQDGLRIRNEITLEPKETIRNEGSMADHYFGHFSRFERAEGAKEYVEVLKLRDLHFYSSAASHPLHWSYQGETGAPFWGKLEADFETCIEGKEQSPINLSPAQAKSVPEPLLFDYHPTKASLVNNGHTLLVNVADGNTISIQGKRYTLLQFHVHSPSEHLLDSKEFDLEAHFVHQAADKSFAVVGVFVKVSPDARPHEGLSKILQEFPRKLNEPVEYSGDVVLERFLPPKGNRKYLAYPGSLTTPPCTEKVAWHVLTQPVPITQKQKEEILEVLRGKNARRLRENSLDVFGLGARTLFEGPN